jgi:hypothetical protein
MYNLDMSHVDFSSLPSIPYITADYFLVLFYSLDVFFKISNSRIFFLKKLN